MDALMRQCREQLVEMLDASPAVLLVGARQTGKSFLAREIAAGRPSVYFDLEDPDDLMALANPGDELRRHPGKLVVIDEVQHKPDLFGLIRVLIDEQRRQGDASGKFLLLGSVVEKLQGQSESLAGRVMEMQLHPFNLLEALAAGSLSAFRAWQQERPALGAGREEDALMEFLRQRGGYPESLLAGDEESARKWRHSYLRTVIRKDASSPRVAEERFLRLLELIADKQGSVTPRQEFARQMGLKKGAAVEAMLATLRQMMLILRLPAYGNIKYQARKACKYYICDSGIHNDLLNRRSDDLPQAAAGANWEGFVIGNIISILPAGWRCFYFKNAKGREIDLIVERPGGAIWAIEIKSGPPDLSQVKELSPLFAALGPERSFLVHGGSFKHRPSGAIEIRSLHDIMQEIRTHDDLASRRRPARPAGARPQYQSLLQALEKGDRMLNLRRDDFIADAVERIGQCCRQATGPGDRQAHNVWTGVRNELLEWLKLESRIQPHGEEARLWQQALYTALEKTAELPDPPAHGGQSPRFRGEFSRLCCHDLFVHVAAVLLANSCHEFVFRMTTHRYRVRGSMLAFICFWSGPPADTAVPRLPATADKMQTVGEFMSSHSCLAIDSLLQAELLLFVSGMILCEKLLGDEREAARAKGGYFCWDPWLIESVRALPPLEFFQQAENREGMNALLACLGIAPAAQGVRQLKQVIGKYTDMRMQYSEKSRADLVRALNLENWHEFPD